MNKNVFVKRLLKLPHKEEIKELWRLYCSNSPDYFSSGESMLRSFFLFFLFSLKITYKGQPSNNGGRKTNRIRHPQPLITHPQMEGFNNKIRWLMTFPYLRLTATAVPTNYLVNIMPNPFLLRAFLYASSARYI